MVKTQDVCVNLDTKWFMYFHDFMDSNWNRESYEKLGVIDSIIGFWTIFHIMKDWLCYGMFFFMRQDIFPKWDDNQNMNMSFMSMKILKMNTSDFMEEILVLMMSNSLFYDKNNAHLINGISISPKKNFCICKICIDSIDDTYKDINLYNIPKSYHGDILLRNFT